MGATQSVRAEVTLPGCSPCTGAPVLQCWFLPTHWQLSLGFVGWPWGLWGVPGVCGVAQAHLGRAAVALLARLHHAVAADGAVPGQARQARALEQAGTPALLQEGLKGPDAAVTKGFCPAEIPKTKQLPVV